MHSYIYTYFTYTKNERSHITKYFAIGFRWDLRNEHLILKGPAGEENMGKGDKRGIAQRSDGGESVLLLSNLKTRE